MPAENQDPSAIVADITKAMSSMKEENQKVLAELKTSNESNGKLAADAVARAEDAAKKISAMAENIVSLEQKLADSVIKGKAPVQTLGQMVIKSDAYKQYAAGQSGRMTIQANTIIGQEGSPAENSDTIVAPQRLPGIIPGAFRLLKIADVVPQGTTGSNAVEYTRELLFTNAAAETAEGASKPESTLTFELATANIRTIAHIIKASKQVLDDAPMLQSYIDTRMRYGVELRKDQQLLTGNGTGQNISGMMDSGNFTAFTPVTGDNALDSINRAIYLVLAADYPPTAIIMNPADWGAIERLKVSDTDDRYVIGDPRNPIGPTLWGLPVVVSNAMTAGSFLVGSMPIAYQIWNRQNTVVEMFEQDDVNVQKNLVTIRAESRLTLATYRPASVRSGLLTL
jgi:HK97 family phage major capsid protein